MSVESIVNSSCSPITESNLQAACRDRGILIRFLDKNGMPLQTGVAGILSGLFIAIGWPSSDSTTTAIVDLAILVDMVVQRQLGLAECLPVHDDVVRFESHRFFGWRTIAKCRKDVNGVLEKR